MRSTEGRVAKRHACIWVGIDAGKSNPWAAGVGETGATVWSKKIDNDESAILPALGEILDLADEVRWAVDISGTSSAPLPALLSAHGQQALYVPGRTVNRMAGAYPGEAKTDARDAYVIAETTRHRRDFAAIDVPARPAADLALLTAHRMQVRSSVIHEKAVPSSNAVRQPPATGRTPTGTSSTSGARR
ncbi:MULTISPECIES: IS110 family transposase [unclassified Streptomyces]|uniref:IS110 family transposase n=1 Tax=unclassified Streptomyces TaxID=2593676 RepID=UPI0038700DBF